MFKRLIVLFSLLMLPALAVPVYVQAADVNVDVFDKGVCNSRGTSNAAVCQDKKVGNNNPISGPDGVLTRIINLLTIVVGIVAVITIILAGLKFITSSTNPQDVANARERVIYSVVALIIAGMAQLLVRFILNVVPG